MRLEKVQEALKTKKIHYEYTEENGCGSIDFMFRGLRFHIWEYEDRVWGAEQTCSKQAEARILREITRKLFPEKSSHGRICCLGCKYVTVHSNTLQGVEICEK